MNLAGVGQSGKLLEIGDTEEILSSSRRPPRTTSLAASYVPMRTKPWVVLHEDKGTVGDYRETEQSNVDGTRAVQNDMTTLRSVTKLI